MSALAGPRVARRAAQHPLPAIALAAARATFSIDVPPAGGARPAAPERLAPYARCLVESAATLSSAAIPRGITVEIAVEPRAARWA